MYVVWRIDCILTVNSEQNFVVVLKIIVPLIELFFLEAERVQERKKTSASGSVKQHEDPLIIVCFDCEELVCQRCTLKDHKDHKYEIFLSKISLEALANLCLTQANITIAVDPAKCTVDLTARAEVGKPCVLILTTRLSNGKPDNGKCEVTCHIKSLYNGETTDCAIDKDGTGRYSIKYTPAVRGRHELTVLINGHHVAGSPFPVYASIHPTQLGEPVKIWTTEKQPYTITGNSKREIFVDLCGGGIVKFDSKGNRRDMIMECDRSEHCIACDSKDKIYFMRGKNIATCDGNGDNVQIHGELENQKDPKSLAISDENLIVAEVNSIKVYNKQLQYIATFEHNNMSMDIVDISVDIHQNIYVTDKKEKSCHIFKDRKYVSSFKSSLKCPRGLCVHHQYVYVADVSRHCIRVFTTDGGYVTSFGQRGQERGQFCWPSFVYVDEDGFIYVTDMDNKRIQCF